MAKFNVFAVLSDTKQEMVTTIEAPQTALDVEIALANIGLIQPNVEFKVVAPRKMYNVCDSSLVGSGKIFRKPKTSNSKNPGVGILYRVILA